MYISKYCKYAALLAIFNKFHITVNLRHPLLQYMRIGLRTIEFSVFSKKLSCAYSYDLLVTNVYTVIEVLYSQQLEEILA